MSSSSTPINMRKDIAEIEYLINISRYEQAVEKLDKCISIEPNESRLMFLKAFALNLQEKYQESLSACLEALREEPTNDVYLNLLGDIYYNLEDFVESERIYIKALSINPQKADTLASYGMLMFRTGFVEKGTKLIQEALRIEPTNKLALHFQFLHSAATKNKNEKLDSLIQYLEYEDNESNKVVNIAISNFMEEDYKTARKNMKQAFLMEPTNKAYLEMLIELDKAAHWTYAPIRLIRKLGGPVPLWLFLVTLAFINSLLFKYFPNSIVVIIFGAITMLIVFAYILLAVFSWTAPLTYRVVLFFSRIPRAITRLFRRG